MAGAMTIRELITKYSFKTDEKPIKRLDRAVEGLKEGIGRFDQAMKAALLGVAKYAAVAAGAAGVAMVKMASDAEESESKFQAVFKDQADAARKWSEQFADAANRSGFALRNMAAGLQDTFVPLGFARDTAAQLSTNLTELAIDVASFQNKAEPEVVDAFTSAIVGNHEAVRSFGIVMTEARLKKKIAELKREMPGFTRVSVEQQKVLARYKIILESTSDAHGDVIKTSGGFANQMRGLRARVEKVAIEIGQKLLPIATKWVGIAAKWIKQNEGLIKQKAEQAINAMVKALQVMGKVLGWVVENWSTVKYVLMALVAGRVAAGIGSIASQVGSMAGALAQVTAGAGGLTGAVGKAAGGVGKLAGGLGVVGKLGAALGVGWTIGTALDQAFDLSGKLAKGIWAINEALKAPQRRAKRERFAREAGQAQLERTAKQFAAMRQRGIEAVQTRTGGRVALDEAGITKLLQQQAKNVGLSAKQLAPMLPALVRQAQLIPEAAAGAGAQQTTQSFQVGAPQITVNVPPGTPATQAQRIAEAAGTATRRSMRQAMGDVQR